MVEPKKPSFTTPKSPKSPTLESQPEQSDLPLDTPIDPMTSGTMIIQDISQGPPTVEAAEDYSFTHPTTLSEMEAGKAALGAHTARLNLEHAAGKAAARYRRGVHVPPVENIAEPQNPEISKHDTKFPAGFDRGVKTPTNIVS